MAPPGMRAFLPFSLAFGAIARAHGVYTAGWILLGACAVLGGLLATSTRASRGTQARAGAAADLTDPEPRPGLSPPPDELACQQLVRLASDYLDGDLPPDWRARITDHLHACDGCTTYLEQIRHTIALLDQAHTRPGRAASAAATRPYEAGHVDTDGTTRS